MIKKLFPLVAAVVGLMAGAPAAAAQEYLVIVNDANTVETVNRDELSQIFLKRVSQWPNGNPVVPVDLSESSSTREAFSQAVHGRPVSAIEAYWQRQIFSGRGVPPVEKSAETEVIEYVRTNPHAVGYVRNGSALGAGVRAVRVTN